MPLVMHQIMGDFIKHWYMSKVRTIVLLLYLIRQHFTHLEKREEKTMWTYNNIPGILGRCPLDATLVFSTKRCILVTDEVIKTWQFYVQKLYFGKPRRTSTLFLSQIFPTAGYKEIISLLIGSVILQKSASPTHYPTSPYVLGTW